MYNIIEKTCVRIQYGEDNIGSGVLIADNETFYVLTAAHCLGDEDVEIEKENIVIKKQFDYASEFNNISVKDIVDIDFDKDYCLIEIDFDDEEKLLNSYKFGKGFIKDLGVKFCGYQNINLNQYRPFDAKIVTVSDIHHKFKIKLIENTFDQAGEIGYNIAKGLSGSGVFIFQHNTPFLIGILNSVLEDQAWNDDIECCSIAHLEKYFTEYVNLSDIEQLKKWEENIEKERTKQEIESFKELRSEFFDNLYRKNTILYPDKDVDRITSENIKQFISIEENIKTLENSFPEIFIDFKRLVKKQISTVTNDYSRTVSNSNEAKNQKLELQKFLEDKIEKQIPKFYSFDLSEYQVLQWLGICTLNFIEND
ncbi:trypsin-like serine protease [Chryseobacterium sp. Mn2064]|uniref:trypsin-like serine protease n=1 Tax=Chryseobacterium sp. Mn2064 TaxID=3395263 RepID=UPI003BD4A897